MAPCSVGFAQALAFAVHLKHGALGFECLGTSKAIYWGDLEGLDTYLVYTSGPKGVAI